MTYTGNQLLDHSIHSGDYATVKELAAAAGIAPEGTLALLSPLLSTGTMRVEPVGGQFFLHTAPQGRGSTSPIPPNNWERLRILESPEEAARVWSLARDLEHAGWQVSCDPAEARRFSPVSNLALITRFSKHPAPVLAFLDVSAVGASLAVLRASDTPIAALICKDGDLDPTVSEVRNWYLQSDATRPGILVLEAPSFQPTPLAPHEASLQALSTWETLGPPAGQ